MHNRLSAEGYRAGSYWFRTVIDGIILWQDRPVSGSAGNPHNGTTWSSGNGCYIPQAASEKWRKYYYLTEKSPGNYICRGIFKEDRNRFERN